MIVAVMLDDHGGMTFNHRRQSQDRVLRADLLDTVGNAPLWMNAYSQKQFLKDTVPTLRVDEDFLAKAQNGEYCFCEDQALTPYQDKIEQLILYRWNRTYPADFSFDLSLTGWKCVSVCEFAGSSHEKITKEVYQR